MKNDVFLSDELQMIIDNHAKSIGLTTSAYITDQLENLFKDELNHIPQKSFSQLYQELKQAIITYVNSPNHKTKFTLRDIPYYQELGIVCPDRTYVVPSAIRIRLGKSINNEISQRTCPELSNIRRAKTKSGNLAFNCGAAVYEIF